jgi:hypothetical protein
MSAITSGQGVLLPDSTRKNRKQRTVTIAVNSRDRNLMADYKTNPFRWTFRRPLKDVVSIELVNGCVPTSLYNLNTGWNIFFFYEHSTQYTVTLTPGQYTATELCSELQRALNAIPGISNTYTVAYSGTTKKMSVSTGGTAPFSFNFQDTPYTDTIDGTSGSIQLIGCPARIFGFENWIYDSVGGVITPPNRMDPSLFLQRLYLHLNADNSVEFSRVEMGAGRKDCFHIMYLDQSTGGYYTLNRDTYTPIFYSAPAPISRIATLNISLRDEFYRVVDLGGHDFTLVFEVTYLE